MYHPASGRDPSTLAPEGQIPAATLTEQVVLCQHTQTHTQHSHTCNQSDVYSTRRRCLARFNSAWEQASFSPLGSLLLTATLPISLLRLQLFGFAPLLKEQMKQSLLRTFLPAPATDFRPPYAPAAAAALLAATFRNIGTTTPARFAPLVVIFGHGSLSVNNPFEAAYQCGACGGRDGGPNARLMARLGNDAEVRRVLMRDFGIEVPGDTYFVAGTTSGVKGTGYDSVCVVIIIVSILNLIIVRR